MSDPLKCFMIDTKLAQLERNETDEPWRDGGHIQVGFDRVWRTQPELMSDDELARIISDTKSRGKGVVVTTGVTSAGLLTLSEERTKEVDGFDVFDFRVMHSERDLDKCINRDDIEEGRDAEGAYLAFEVPSNASIDLINRWLVSNYPDYCLDVEVTTKLNSGVGANILTGLLGENRRPVEANGLVMVVAGRVEPVRGKESVDAYRGTQGYAGIVKKVRIVARKQPINPGMILLPLTGNDIESSFATSYAQVLSNMAPWIYGIQDGGTRISAADILDITGLRTIHRVHHHGDESGFKVPDFLAEQIDGDHSAMICLRTEGPTAPASNEAMVNRLGDLMADERVGNVQFLDQNKKIDPIVARRGQVPERAREENLLPGVYSTSMDMDVKIMFNPGEVDFTDERTRLAYEAAYQAIIRSYRPLEELQAHGIHFIWNGHFFMTNSSDYYVGGHNPHPRVTGHDSEKGRMTAAKKETTASLNRLHGQKFGPFTVCVQEGEKHYPHDAQSQAHFAATQPHWSKQRALLTAKAGVVHNARVPATYEQAMKVAGVDLK